MKLGLVHCHAQQWPTPDKSTLSPPLNGVSASISSMQLATTLSIPAKPKMDVHKLFRGSSSAGPSQPSPSEILSPSLRPSGLPNQHQPSQQPQPGLPPSQLGAHQFTLFIPSRPLSSGQLNSGPNRGPPGSPVCSQRMVNGLGGCIPSGQNGPQVLLMSAGLSSPCLAPHMHPGKPSEMPPQPQPMPVPGWPGHFVSTLPGSPSIDGKLIILFRCSIKTLTCNLIILLMAGICHRCPCLNNSHSTNIINDHITLLVLPISSQI